MVASVRSRCARMAVNSPTMHGVCTREPVQLSQAHGRHWLARILGPRRHRTQRTSVDSMAKDSSEEGWHWWGWCWPCCCPPSCSGASSVGGGGAREAPGAPCCSCCWQATPPARLREAALQPTARLPWWWSRQGGRLRGAAEGPGRAVGGAARARWPPKALAIAGVAGLVG